MKIFLVFSLSSMALMGQSASPVDFARAESQGITTFSGANALPVQCSYGQHAFLADTPGVTLACNRTNQWVASVGADLSSRNGVTLANSGYATITTAIPTNTSAFANPLTPGSVIVAGVSQNAGSTCVPTDTAGNTYADSGAGLQVSAAGWAAQIYIAYNTHSTTSNVVSCANGSGNYTVLNASEWTGVTPSGAVESYAVSGQMNTTAASTGNIILPAIQTVTANDVVLTLVAVNPGTMTAGLGYTLFQTNAYAGMQYGYAASPGVISGTMTGSSSSAPWVGTVIALKPARLYPVLTSLSGSLASPVTMTTPGTFYDGPSVALTAGKWKLDASVNVQTTSLTAAVQFTCKLWDGTTTVSAGYIKTPTLGTASVENSQIPLTGYLTETGAATAKVSCTSDTASQLIEAAPGYSSPGNYASTITALRTQ